MAPRTLRERWLAAMRASTTRALGRECDYAMSEGDADTFDPIGLLCYLRFGCNSGPWRSGPGHDGAWVDRNTAAALALTVGFPLSKLYDLALLNDAGVSWADMADYVEAQQP